MLVVLALAVLQEAAPACSLGEGSAAFSAAASDTLALRRFTYILLARVSALFFLDWTCVRLLASRAREGSMASSIPRASSRGCGRPAGAAL